MSKNINDIIERIKELNGELLVSVIQYSGNRILVLLKELNIDNLTYNSRISRKLQKSGYIPVFLTLDHINTSADVYPLEYLQMIKPDRILYGDNIFEGIEIPTENVRLESEQKIKGVLIRMTQVVLETGGNSNRLSKICFLAMEDLISGLTGMLYLAGIDTAGNAPAVIEAAEKNFKTDLQIFRDMNDWANGTKPPDPKKTLYDFYEKIEQVSVLVDGMAV